MSVDPRDVQPFLPSIERAKSAGVELKVDRGLLHRERSLIDETPVAERRCLAFIVRARLVTRQAWTAESEVSEARFATLDRQAPTARDDVASSSFRVLREVLTPEPESCSFCRTSPGEALCTVCGGTGRMMVTRGDGPGGSREHSVPCAGCGASGKTICGTCDGSARTHRVVLEQCEDTLVAFDCVFLPVLASALEEPLKDHFAAWTVLPAPLAYDLEEGDSGSGGAPYRSGAPGEPERWGYLLGDAARGARESVARFSAGHVVSQQIAAVSVPLLLVEYEREAVAVISPTSDGGVVGFAGFAGGG